MDFQIKKLFYGFFICKTPDFNRSRQKSQIINYKSKIFNISFEKHRPILVLEHIFQKILQPKIKSISSSFYSDLGNYVKLYQKQQKMDG